jgi:type I restriction enzyme R subunit
MSVYFKDEVGAEAILEENLIDQLVKDTKSNIGQWVYRGDITTDDELWDNLRQKLDATNKDVLLGKKLTDNEFAQVKTFLSFSSAYDAATWLQGENGVAHIPYQPSDASRKRQSLVAFVARDIAGGSSSYEIINQYVSNKSKAVGEDANDRRFDVTLLINGIPMIHIELKTQNHPYMDAYRQLEKYTREGHFHGLFSCVQMFVVSNGSNTRYFAPAAATDFDGRFLIRWSNVLNQPVENLQTFAEQVLTIPMGHKMVAHFTVIDYAHKRLMLMRPYQIHALEAVFEAAKYRKSGFVWHTTGSGKTITAYKVAQRLLWIPSVNHTVYIVDRVDLDDQATDAFQSYAKFENFSVEGTDNSGQLINALHEQKQTAIITTAQKLGKLIDYYKKRYGDEDPKHLHGLRLEMIVDECHRSISAEQMARIKEFFPQSDWYGFTGTPIFDENKKTVKGQLPDTTEKQFGEVLSTYNIQDALRDGSVLDFQPDYQRPFEDYDLDVAVAAASGKTQSELIDMDPMKKEALLPSEYFDDEKHLDSVIDYILNKSSQKLGFQRGSGNTFEGILTTGTIPRAVAYYKRFKEVLQNSDAMKKRIKLMAPDGFPKIALTYSAADNNKTGDVERAEDLYAAIDDYNEMFGTTFQHDQKGIASYNSDLSKRLSRKESKYTSRSEQLDLVIVARRLLTGFDAPILSTLYVDRPVMSAAELIQSFSRTNRTFDDRDKPHGQIVTFQSPVTYRHAVNAAITLYAHGGESVALAPEWRPARIKLHDAVAKLKQVAPEWNTVTEESTVTEQTDFVKAFQSFAKAYQDTKFYAEFDADHVKEQFGIDDNFFDEYNGNYQNVLEHLKSRVTDDGDSDDVRKLVELDFELSLYRSDIIDYNYIMRLIAAYSDEVDDLTDAQQDKRAAEIADAIDKMSKDNPKIAAIINDLWGAVDAGDLHSADLMNRFNEEVGDKLHEALDGFSAKWQVDSDKLAYTARHFDPKADKVQEQPGYPELKGSFSIDQYLEHGGKKEHFPFKYAKNFNQDLASTLREDVAPLIHF